MRFLFTNNPPVIAYGIAQGLEQIGEEVKVLNLWQTDWNQQKAFLEDIVEEFKPDYLFTEGDPPNFNREAVVEVAHERGIPLIYWAIQDPVWFREVSQYCSLKADFVFTTTIELLAVIPDFINRWPPDPSTSTMWPLLETITPDGVRPPVFSWEL